MTERTSFIAAEKRATLAGFATPAGRVLLVILAVSVLLRVAAAATFGDQVVEMPGTADQISYHTLAQRVLAGYGFTFGEPWWPATAANSPTAHWSYLYTAYLASVYGLLGTHPLLARLLQALLVGLLHPYLAFRIGKHLFGARVGLLAAGSTAVYVYFVYYAASLMSEAFYITAVLASLYLALLITGEAKETGLEQDKKLAQRALLLGLAVAAAVLLRQLFLLFVPFMLLWMWAAMPERRLTPFLITMGTMAAVILPITLFNYARFDRFVLLNTNAGYAFFWGNHPVYGTQFQPILPAEMGSYGDLIPDELRHLDEAALDQALLKRGLQFVLEDPVRYIRLSFSRIPSYFMFWPSKESGWISNISRVASFGAFLPFMLYGIWLSLSQRAPAGRAWYAVPVWLLYLFAVIYTGVHLLSWTLVRYRLPVDSVLVIPAGVAMADLIRRVPALHRRLSLIG